MHVIDKANELQNKNPRITNGLLIDMLQTLQKELGYQHFNQLIADDGHGFNHAFFVVELSLELTENRPEIDTDTMVCGALLHDLDAVINRNDHDVTGSERAKHIARCINSKKLNVEGVSYIVRSHNKKAFSGHWHYEAGIVRDADTLHEGLDLERIVSIGKKLRTPFYSPETYKNGLECRLNILINEDRSVIETKECDILMFLLRNVTKSVAPDGYVTEEARKFIMSVDVVEKNMAKLEQLILMNISDKEHQNNALKLVDRIFTQFWKNRKMNFATPVFNKKHP